MSEAYEYGEDDIEDDVFDEDDEIRQQILEAEADEVWQEEPGDEEDEARLMSNPLFGLFSAAGGMNIPGFPKAESKDEN